MKALTPGVSVPTTTALIFLLLLSVAPQAGADELDSELEDLAAAEQEYQFVQTRTCMPSGPHQCEQGEQPLPVQWATGRVEYVINERGSQALHPDESELTDALKEDVFVSFEQWNEPDCSDFEMIYAGKTSRDQAGYDDSISRSENLNIILWRDESWPHPQYDAVALTTVTFQPQTGEIVNADIEFNTADYRFTNSDDEVQVDVRNTLTHEVGHFLGLDHSPVSSSTMFATAPPGETQKRDLHDADIAGLCFIYPEGETYDLPDSRDSGTGTSTCSSASPGLNSSVFIVAFALLGWSVVRRRRQLLGVQ